MTYYNDTRQERIWAAIGVRTGVSDKLGSIWWSFLLRGIFAIVFGIFALFWPGLSLETHPLQISQLCVGAG